MTFNPRHDMRSAMWQGLAYWIAISLLAYAVVEITLLFDARLWPEELADTVMGCALVGAIGGFLGYAIHPKAKGLPKPIRAWLSPGSFDWQSAAELA